ncbi:MAG TPA: 23S rRNA (pseudouridine(1915)-N(3))-methyltransferase RlmH [Vitreimonas sp.]|uniref:23S rRNA (pseudouridine(1915)-N(3))-methyltransferase RlmH n=1 Tax=Vitreimonas sp. TaxID=3069702 RepID=UPI002D3AC2C3|nr:23S rRNA (pseudouridine(1915)-N(3))-methyltransferase RlmH [Vitreimonas sp.]HYD89712.1 23S rRNA (pseudouridine(1915)-N(3))-methyltransferase RlmH [Vitreimonas sp.]
MRIQIAVVGRLRDGPEAALSADYVARAAAAGKQLGFKAVELTEVEGKPPGDPRAEASALYRATPDDARKILLDERGAEWSSRQLAEKLARWRDDGVPCATFWIGGADGVSQSIKDNADEKLAFGRQTWPHRLVRVMISEQVYRAVTILCGTPYHRD